MKQIRQTWVLTPGILSLNPLDHDDFNEEIRLCEPSRILLMWMKIKYPIKLKQYFLNSFKVLAQIKPLWLQTASRERASPSC